MLAPQVDSSNSTWWRKAAFGISLAAFCLFVSWDTLKAPFAADEMMAIWWYYHPTPWRLLWSQFMLWHGYTRPFGGFFYLPTYLIFGLDPVPYHALLLMLLLAGAYIMYRFARALGSSEMTAAIVALIACYHGGLSNLYYNSVFVFDVLCGIFYFAAFTYYARIRAMGRLLRGGEIAVFLVLYVCALNAKEMAVTMPAILLAYEWLYYGRPKLDAKSAIAWLRGPALTICWASIITIVFMYGKALGPSGLIRGGSAYRPVYSWERTIDFQERHLGDIFYHVPRFELPATIAIWLAVTYLAWRPVRGSPQRLLRFCWFYIVLTPLPMQFLIGRDQACLYVTLAGWAVLCVTLFMDWVPSAARVLAGEPLFRRLGPERVRMFLIAAAMVAYAAGSWRYKESEVTPAIPALSPVTAHVLAEFRSMNPQVERGAKVIFLDDPFPHTFDMAFIAELWFRDRTARILLNQKTPLPSDQIAAADAVFTWSNEKLVRVR